MPTVQQINIARQYGRLYRLHRTEVEGIENLYYEWVGTNVPHYDHKELHMYFNGADGATPPDQVRVRDLMPGDRIKRGTDVVTVASIHHVRDANGEYWNIYHTPQQGIRHHDGDFKYPRCVEPPTRLVKVSALQPGDWVAVDELSQRIVTKVIRQEITTMADQKARVRYAVYVNGEPLPAFDDLLPDFSFKIKAES